MTDLAYADPEEFEMMEETEPPEAFPLELIAGQGMDLAQMLDDAVLDKLTRKCLEAYDRDKQERAEWEEAYDKIMAMVGGKRDKKTFPWPGASNIKYPLIQTASLQFGARAYPAIVNGTDVAKVAVIGDDPEGQKRARADRIGTHMNHQLLIEMPEWDEDTDRLVHSLPIQGMMFRQVMWNDTYSRPQTRLINGKQFVVTQGCKDLEAAPHFALEFELFQHQIHERMKAGEYRTVELGMQEEEEKAGEQAMLECHCRYDLDEDGYDEPYIATIHKASEKMVSLKAGFWPNGIDRGEDGSIIRVRRHVEFVPYRFLPDPDGKFYGIGFGQLLLEHSEIVNSMLNQLLDAATDQNAGGGFIGRGVNMQGGVMDVPRGEYMFLNASGDDIRRAIVERPTAQPSPVMFQLLGLMIDSAKELSSNQDVMNGDAPQNAPATTTLAMIEEGMRVFSSIYKRIYRALTAELRLIAMLNQAYLPPEKYVNVLDEQAIPQQDYEWASQDVVPVADPSITTSAQKMARAQFLMQIGGGNPMLDQKEIMRRVLEAASIDNIETLMPEPDPQAQQMQQQQMQMEMRKVMAEIMADETGAMENAANAKLKEVQANVAAQEAMINLAAMRMTAMNMMGPMYAQPGMGGMAGMAGPSANAGLSGGFGAPMPGQPPAMAGGGMGVQQPGPVGPIGPDARFEIAGGNPAMVSPTGGV